MHWYAYLFWAWVFGSAGIWIWRRVGNKASPTTSTKTVPDSSSRGSRWQVAATPPSPLSETGYSTDISPREKASLGVLLAGIQLPSGLAPLTHGVEALGFDEVAIFATDTASYQDTKNSLEAELNRLGFTLTPLDDTSIRAQTATGALEIEFFGSAKMDREFATATPGATVVEIRVAT